MEPNLDTSDDVTLPMVTIFVRDDSDDETMPTFSFPLLDES